MSTKVKENNKRIAKNTIMLYIRMFVVMAVTLYTSRVVLSILGAEDYGINNVVGGIVLMMSFMSNTMTHSAQRFFSMELGLGNTARLTKIFQVNLSIYLAIGLIVIILGETLGFWFLSTYMSIPFERMNAAAYVLHFAVLSFCLSMFVLPFRAAIMARENMSIMAYLSIVEAIAKLVLVYLLLIIQYDKLIMFSILNFVVVAVINLFYVEEACRKYEECKIKISYDKEILRSVLGFTGWSLLGHFAMIVRSQGINILLNIFCGPVVNAARAIAYQVNTAVSQFYTNFFMAVKPQLIKYYSVEDKKNMYHLMIRSSKLCYFLVFVLSLPIILKSDFVLEVWLKEVPEFTSLFVVLVLVNTLVESLMPGLTTSIDATGNIKTFQILVSIVLLLNLPISWILLKYGYSPYIPFVFIIILSVVRLVLQMVVVNNLLGFATKDILTALISPVLAFTGFAIIIPVGVRLYFDDSWMSFIIIAFISVISAIIFGYFVLFDKNEKTFIKNIVLNKINIKQKS